MKALKTGSFSALSSVTPCGTCRMSLPMEQFLWTLASSSVGFRGQIRIIQLSLGLLTLPVSFLCLPLHLMGLVSVGLAEPALLNPLG